MATDDEILAALNKAADEHRAYLAFVSEAQEALDRTIKQADESQSQLEAAGRISSRNLQLIEKIHAMYMERIEQQDADIAAADWWKNGPREDS